MSVTNFNDITVKEQTCCLNSNYSSNSGSTQTVIDPSSSILQVHSNVVPFSKPNICINVIGMVVLSELPVVLALFTFVLNFNFFIPPDIYFVVFKLPYLVMTLLVFITTFFVVMFVTSKVVTFISNEVLSNIVEGSNFCSYHLR